MQLRCLALFDWSSSIDDSAFFRIGLGWFRSKVPNLGAISVARTIATTSKSISEKKLNEMIAGGEKISSLEICPNGADDFTQYFCITESVGGARSLTVTLPSKLFQAEDAEGFVTEMASLGELGYGICLAENDAKNPAFYMRGVTHGEPKTEEDEDEARRDSIWFMERLPMKGSPPKMRHKAGLLRDVYEINVLNNSHARAVVDGQDLVSWIGESKVRGTLKPISANNLLWTIPPQYIRHIRDGMSKNGLLISSV